MRRVVFDLDDKPQREGWFHTWAGKSEYAYAIVELEDGKIVCVPCANVRFLERVQGRNLELWEPV